MMVEAKGDYANLLQYQENKMRNRWLEQSADQVAGAGGRHIRWYFAEAESAAYAKELFRTEDEGRENIEIIWLPWPGSRTGKPRAAKSSGVEILDHSH